MKTVLTKEVFNVAISKMVIMAVIFSIAVAMLPLLTSVVSAADCVNLPVTGTVNDGNATLVVPANACPVEVSFTSYEHAPGSLQPFENQTVVQNITNTYGPGTYQIGPLTLACN